MNLNTRIKWVKVPTVPMSSTGSATIAQMLQLFAPATQTELPSLEIHLQRVKSIWKFMFVQSYWGRNILYLLHQNQKILYLHSVHIFAHFGLFKMPEYSLVVPKSFDMYRVRCITGGALLAPPLRSMI